MTYSIQHNPNCPSKYLIRLIGDEAGIIDNLPHSSYIVKRTNDRLFYGKTLEEAIDKVLADERVARTRRMQKMHYKPSLVLQE
ncbi:MAG: hypothetical protein V4606_02945 [Patescibacteria group bacterium]